MVRWTSSPSVTGIIDGLEVRRTPEFSCPRPLVRLPIGIDAKKHHMLPGKVVKL
jgi:hypothetical protein